jgi:hypothetical protein
MPPVGHLYAVVWSIVIGDRDNLREADLLKVALDDVGDAIGLPFDRLREAAYAKFHCSNCVSTLSPRCASHRGLFAVREMTKAGLFSASDEPWKNCSGFVECLGDFNAFYN